MFNSTNKIFEGINFSHIKTDKFKTVSIAFLFRTELSKENVTKNILIPEILKRGSKKYSSLQLINEKVESMYGSVFDASIIRKGEEQLVQFYLEFLKMDTKEKSDELESECLEFLKEIIYNPLIESNGFNKNYLESEKNKLKEKIESIKSNKKEYARQKCIEKVFEDEPFGISENGYIKDLPTITNTNLYDLYKFLLEKAPIEIIMIGAFDTKYMLDKIKSIFSFEKLEKNKLELPSIVYRDKRSMEYIEKADITQAKLCLGYKTNLSQKGLDYYKLIIFNEIFGGSSDSKLFASVRDKNSLCYYINSQVYVYKSFIFLQSGINEKDFRKTLKLIEEVFEEIKSNNITDDEFDKAINSIVAKIKSLYDDPASIMDFYLSKTLLNENISLDEEINQFKKIKKHDLLSISDKIKLDTIFLLKGLK